MFKTLLTLIFVILLISLVTWDTPLSEYKNRSMERT